MDLSQCRRIVDIGANVGLFALYASATAPEASLTCFEPCSDTFTRLQRNLAVNRARATAHRLAVSSTNGQRRLALRGSAVEYSLGDGGERFEIVDCVDLATAFDVAGWDTIDFLKMDIEGEELPILTTAPLDVLRRIQALAVEWHHSDIIRQEWRACS